MAVVVGRMLAVLEAQTAQFDARMDAAGRQLSRWNSAAGTATRGTAMFKTGIQQLAFEGLGIMPPALARVSAGMLTIFGPAGIMLGAIAILGLLSLAFERAGKKAQEFVEEANRVREFELSHLKMLGGIGPGTDQTSAERLAGLQVLRERVIDMLERLTPATQSVVAQLGGIDPAAERAQLRIDALTVSLHGLNRAIQELSRPSLFSESLFVPEARTAEAAALFQRAQIQMGATIKTRSFKFVSEMNRLPQEVAPEPRFKMTPEFAVMASMALLQGAQGGPASFFGAAAGPVAMINPLAGAITAGVGTIFSLFDHSEEKRHRELLDAVEKMGKEVGLDRVTLIFTGPDGHQIRKSLAELEEGDAVERVPGPVGAGG